MKLVSSYGRSWARNKKNVTALKEKARDPHGVYVLCDGTMPLYVGRGRIWSRVNKHMKSRSKGQYWDYFSWFEVKSRKMEKEAEALVLRMLPFYLRSLNKQRGNFTDATKVSQVHKNPDPVTK